MAPEKVASLSELSDDTPHQVVVEGVPVCLVRRGETVKAVHDTCSHEEYSLAEGMVWGNAIECALHGSTFDLDTGEPEALPATEPVPVFRVEVDGDSVLVDVEDQRNEAPHPDH